MQISEIDLYHAFRIELIKAYFRVIKARSVRLWWHDHLDMTNRIRKQTVAVAEQSNLSCLQNYVVLMCFCCNAAKK